jgi:hypothetical protein
VVGIGISVGRPEYGCSDQSRISGRRDKLALEQQEQYRWHASRGQCTKRSTSWRQTFAFVGGTFSVRYIPVKTSPLRFQGVGRMFQSTPPHARGYTKTLQVHRARNTKTIFVWRNEGPIGCREALHGAHCIQLAGRVMAGDNKSCERAAAGDRQKRGSHVQQCSIVKLIDRILRTEDMARKADKRAMLETRRCPCFWRWPVLDKYLCCR